MYNVVSDNQLRAYKMLTKANQKQVKTLEQYRALGNTGAIARILSFMIRASLRKTEQVELRQLAAQFGVINHPDFIC
jgi:hypothetical protein